MARPSNTAEMVPMSISLTKAMKEYLDELAAMGTFGGGNPQDVAKFLLNNSMNALFKDGTLNRKPTSTAPTPAE